MTTTYTLTLTHDAYGPATISIEASTDDAAKREALARLRSSGHGWTARLDAGDRPVACRAASDDRWTAIP